MNLKIIKKSFGLLSFTWLSANQIIAQGFLVTHPKEPNAVLSENFKVFVNETEIPVLRVATNNDVSYAQFSFAGQITIRIHVNKSFSSFNLSPHSYGFYIGRL